MINGIHHPSLTTGDLDRALGFYRDLLGFEPVFDFGWEAGTEMSDLAAGITGIEKSTARAVLLRAGNAFLEIFEYTAPASRRSDDRGLSEQGFAHVCFDVDDAHAEHKRLSEAGVVFVSDPVDVGPMRLAYCRDPDGNFVEIQEITDPSSDLMLTAGAPVALD